MCETQKRILELRKQVSIISDYIEMSKKYLPKTEEMTVICDAALKAVKKALEIRKDISESEKE